MSINKKTLLGTVPIKLGMKDAVHVAIVSLQAGVSLKPGERIKMNTDGHAVESSLNDSFGIVDPFLTGTVARGGMFFGLLDMDQIPSVQHHWDHPQHSFAVPTTAPPRNKYLDRYSSQLGLTYEALLAACQLKVATDADTPYSGPLDETKFEEVTDEMRDDLWYEWSNESGHEFPNMGTECCPEHEFPDQPFEYTATIPAP